MKVGGRIFATIGEDAEPPTVSLKREPELAALLRDTYEAVAPGYHLNKRHWNTVTVDGSVPDDEVRRLLDLGARHAHVGQGDESWVVLADPEGNEFCVLAGRRP